MNMILNETGGTIQSTNIHLHRSYQTLSDIHLVHKSYNYPTFPTFPTTNELQPCLPRKEQFVKTMLNSHPRAVTADEFKKHRKITTLIGYAMK